MAKLVVRLATGALPLTCFINEGKTRIVIIVETTLEVFFFSMTLNKHHSVCLYVLLNVHLIQPDSTGVLPTLW